MPVRPPGVPATLKPAMKKAKLVLVPQPGVWLDQDAVSDIATNEFYSRINEATDRIHAGLDASCWVYLHGEEEETPRVYVAANFYVENINEFIEL